MGSTSRRRRIGPFFLVLAAALSVMAVALRQPVVAGQSADWSMSPTSDFPLAGGDYANQRYSTLDQINTTNVNKLGGAWSVHLEEGGAVGNLDGTPTVVNGVMYVSTPRLTGPDTGGRTKTARLRSRDPAGLQAGRSGPRNVAAGRSEKEVGVVDKAGTELTQRAAVLAAQPEVKAALYVERADEARRRDDR